MANAYDVITARILASLEKGDIPWHKPWSARGEAGLPRNLRTLKAYRGVNVWILMSAGFTSPYFLTFKQAQELGGSVRKGEHGLPVVYWQFGEHSKPNDDGELETHEYAFCRYYTVFNVSQCENLCVTPVPPPDEHPEISPIEACDAVVADWQGKPEISHGGERACYFPRYDRVNMPDRNTFDSSEFYYSVLFHELGHSTGHEKRLARNTLLEIESWADSSYSREELCAEMTAAYLCGFTGIANAATERNTAAYLKNWLSVLRKDSKLVLVAAGQAQKAADLILGHAANHVEGGGDHLLPVSPVAPERKAYCITAKGLAIAAKVRCPVSALPIPGEKPLLIRRTILKGAIKGMNIQHIAMEKNGDGHRSLRVEGVDAKNPRIRRRYSFYDQPVFDCKRIIARWVKTQRKSPGVSRILVAA